MKQRKERRRLTPHAHRRVIGLLGLALPSVVVVLSVIFPVRSGWKMLDSISAFYYTSATALFVGVLFALAIFLFVYGGYKGDVADKRLGSVSGVAALGVAFSRRPRQRGSTLHSGGRTGCSQRITCRLRSFLGLSSCFPCGCSASRRQRVKKRCLPASAPGTRSTGGAG